MGAAWAKERRLDEDKRNVILVVHRRSSPPLEFREHLTCTRSRSLSSNSLQDSATDNLGDEKRDGLAFRSVLSALMIPFRSLDFTSTVRQIYTLRFSATICQAVR